MRKQSYSVIAYVVIIIVIIAIVGGLAAMSDGFTNWDSDTWFSNRDDPNDPEDNNQVVVKIDGQNITDNRYVFNVGTEYIIKIDNFNVDSVRVIPNEKNDFAYMWNGSQYVYMFSRNDDLTSAFDIKINADSISFVSSTDIVGILQKMHGISENIIFEADLDLNDEYMTIVISDGDKYLNIDFSLIS